MPSRNATEFLAWVEATAASRISFDEEARLWLMEMIPRWVRAMGVPKIRGDKRIDIVLETPSVDISGSLSEAKVRAFNAHFGVSLMSCARRPRRKGGHALTLSVADFKVILMHSKR